MKFKHRTLIFFSGLTWLIIGMSLLIMGIQFMMRTLQDPSLLFLPGKFSIIRSFAPWVKGTENLIVLVLSTALFVGYLKGRYVLAKSAKRQLRRIQGLPNPASITLLYSKGYYILIASMMLLGVLLRFFPITLDTRGSIDVAIGSALINGSLLFFRNMAQKALNT